MRHITLLAVSLLALMACTPEKQQEADYAQYVNPMIGTDFTGNTYPGAQAPFGMVFQPYASFRYRGRGFI